MIKVRSQGNKDLRGRGSNSSLEKKAGSFSLKDKGAQATTLGVKTT